MSESQPRMGNPDFQQMFEHMEKAEISLANESLWLLLDLASELSSALDLHTLRVRAK